MGPSIKEGNNVAITGRPEKRQTRWCSENETGGGDGKVERQNSKKLKHEEGHIALGK
jgi:hypothetical protein